MKRIKSAISDHHTMPFILLLIVLLTSVFIQWTSDVGAEPLQNPEPVRIAAYAGDTGLLVYVAQAQQYFSENGLDVTIQDYEAGKLAVDALLAGKADVATAADFVFVTQTFDHPDLISIGTIAIADTMGLVASKEGGITDCKDLKGKRIGVTRKSTGEFNLGLFLLACNLSLNDVNVVDLNPSDIVQEMVDGRIDAAESWEPVIYQIKGILGEEAIVLPNQLDHHFYFILVCKKGWLKGHEETAERLLKALVSAEQYVKAHPKDASAFAETTFDLDRQYVDYIFPKHQFSVMLPQALLIRLEDQARWRLKNDLPKGRQTPNYLNSLITDPMLRVKPEGVSLFR